MSSLAEKQNTIALRTIELHKPLEPLTDVVSDATVRLFVTWEGRLLGSMDIDNQYQPISVMRLADAVVERFGLQLLDSPPAFGKDTLWASAMASLMQRYIPEEGRSEQLPDRLPAGVSASVVIATLDRPDDLRQCLQSLSVQQSPRRIEIVVVDNNPGSGLTASVVAAFPGVVLVNEPRRGLSYARNAGIVASTGDIVIATDDDVVAPPDWVERLVTPFARKDVMVVNGNVLPFELETPAQRAFELYGGLGRGFQRFEVNADWFESFRFRAVPTWNLGATANSAFRATIFSHPQIGLMCEMLGAGMPAGVAEDTYLFYKVLKAGFTIVYEPEAYVWHKHRRTAAALRRQLYSYSKGHVAYHMLTALNDGDLRGLVRILYELPLMYRRRIKECLCGRRDYPLSLILLEMRGTLAGFWALWQSWRRVKRMGRSSPYVPVAQRSNRIEQFKPLNA